MTHPEDLLAGYVGGALGEAERAEVEAHLAGCARCRDEVALAGAARAALRSLTEVPAPAGVGHAAIEEARRAAAAATERPWYVRVGPVAAAAAVIAVLALTLPKLGGADNSNRAAEAASAGADLGPGAQTESAHAAPVLEDLTGTDFAPEDLQQIARDTVDAKDTVAAPVVAGDSLTDAATGCIEQQVPSALPSPEGATLIRLIHARFQGGDSFIAIYLQAPAAGEPPTEALVFVVRSDACNIVGYSQLPLGS